jgi:hypothetical protein
VLRIEGMKRKEIGLYKRTSRGIRKTFQTVPPVDFFLALCPKAIIPDYIRYFPAPAKNAADLSVGKEPID